MQRPSEARLERGTDGVLRLSGALSFANVPHLQSQLAPLLAAGGDNVLDLGGVLRSDSAGLALLVEWLRQARQHGVPLRFANIPGQMEAMARVSHVYPLFDDADTATG